MKEEDPRRQGPCILEERRSGRYSNHTPYPSPSKMKRGVEALVVGSKSSKLVDFRLNKAHMTVIIHDNLFVLKRTKLGL